jgi:hypothetical protein
VFCWKVCGNIPATRRWGGNLVIRELVQFFDGRIGSKWMKEIAPNLTVKKMVFRTECVELKNVQIAPLND